jgi:hypothetical protein
VAGAERELRRLEVVLGVLEQHRHLGLERAPVLPDSIEKGTNACAFSTMMSGCASVGALSVVSVASAEYDAVIAPDVSAFHSFVPTIDSDRAIARNGLTLKFDVGTTVGSSV